jgi:hypothetical protein
MRTALASLLALVCACSARSSLDVPSTHGTHGTGGAGGAGGTTAGGADAGFPCVAFTGEPAPPAPPPCTEYLGVNGDPAACGIPSSPGPVPAAACQKLCGVSACELFPDGTLGFGPIVIGCGCQ